MSRFGDKFQKRAARVRYRISCAEEDRLRLSVFRSQRHIYVQVIDDKKAATLCSASTKDKGLTLKKTSTIQAAESVGALIAERARTVGVEKVVFDRGGYRYHGKVKALAEAARKGGLSF
ncbi:MAG: 50S ribosomal protein L18 [Holosporales bacterium]|jgi:large subunit ribosomal protein L18|nr:50S ribosomal protein L18 [Holosporales bacterium]